MKPRALKKRSKRLAAISKRRSAHALVSPALFYPTPPALVRVLTEDAEFDRMDWASLGGCTCFLSPPCGYCTHDGHPLNQEETPECWQMVPADTV